MTASGEAGNSPGRTFSVTALTQSIRKNLLANNPKLSGVWIEGEISGNKIYSSGHRYFTLKDADAAISCVLFAFNVQHCDDAFHAALKNGESAVNGLKVQVQGELDLNMSRGQYSFKVRSLRIAGQGDRMAAFNALKKKLEEEDLNKLDHPELRTYLTSPYEAAYAPAWSPDGKLIAYTGFRDGDVGWGVYVMPSDGVVTQRIADGRNPSFAPDGKSIIYDRDGKVYRREVTR